MKINDYFESLSMECDALRNRVRHFINDAHWLTDGEWKESVLRAMINRSISSTVSVGRGFIVKKDSCSKQIDVLIYDGSHPVLYRDGDLVFIPPISCKGIIEVKSRITTYSLKKVLNKIAYNTEFILNTEPQLDIFVGLFAFETNYKEDNQDHILQSLNHVANENRKRVINHLSLGKSIFVKYWESNPNGNGLNYDSWHTYKLENKAPGYFLHNLMSYVSDKKLISNENIWFPENGKENKRLGVLGLSNV